MGLSDLPLLERSAELKRLRRALTQAKGGTGRLVVIEGEAGIGKTSLLAQTLRTATRRGFAAFTARAGALESTLGYGVALQLFEGPLRRATAARRRALLTGAAALAAPLLGIELDFDTGSGAPLGGAAAQHGLYWLVANLAAERPSMIAVDDAQWCDEPSLHWLLYLARRFEALPVAVVLAVRSGEPDAPSGLLNAIAAEPGAETIAPAPLSEIGAAALLERSYGFEVEPAFGRACHEWTAGNPFLLSELARELAAEGVEPKAATAERMRGVNPDSIGRSALLRLESLGPEAAAVARALAILGSGSALADAAALGGLGDGEARAAGDALVAAAILEPEQPLRFAHPVIESVIYADLPPAQRAAQHQRAAQLLDRRGAPPERVAVHLLRSDPSGDLWRVERLREAARAELARGVPEAAAALLRRALDESVPEQRTQTLRELGFAEDLAGHARAAEQRFREARELADSPRQRAEIALELGVAMARQGRFDDASALLRAELELSRDADTALRLSLEVQLCLAAQFASGGGWREAQERLERLAPSLSVAGAEGRAGLAALAVRRGQDAAPAAPAIELAAAALDASLVAGAGAELVIQGSAITVLVRLDALDQAEIGAEAALAHSRALGSRVGVAQALYLQGLACRSRGRLAEAAGAAEAGIEVVEQHRPMLARALGVALLVDVLCEQGKLEAAGEQLARRELLGELPEEAMFGALLESRGRWHLLGGDPEGALRDLTEAGARHSRWGSISPAFTSWRSSSALALVALGERERAAKLAGEELELARRVRLPRPLGVALLVRGLIEGGEAGIVILGEAVEALERSPARLEHARALVELGAAQRRTNRRLEAREPLREGLELAHRCGARALEERAREELRATGARPRGAAQSGLGALTPAQLRVCRMAAEGMSNPEIAQGLFVTRATVESHLHSAYVKLAIGSRSELARALAESAGASPPRP
jgi:DNA-binding CsgD family transcriptional regulator